MARLRTLTISLSAFALSATLAACGSNDAPPAEDETAAPAPVEETDVVKLRQDNFKGIGDAFKVIRDQLDADTPDMAAISEAAATINANAQKIPDYFPEGTGMDSGADTEALAAIWEMPDDFAAAQQRLVSASEDLMAAAATGDPAAVGEQIPNLGGSCKNCHDTFRKPPEE